MRTSAIFFLALLVVHAAVAGTKPQRVIVDIQASRAEIRQALLKQTPAGSSIRYVLGFISNQLEIPGSVSEIKVLPAKGALRSRAANTIHVYLGHYYKHLGAVFLTAPMVVHEDVNAQWLFDRNGRLIDIVVDKRAGVY
jgi:hypothetical protein